MDADNAARVKKNKHRLNALDIAIIIAVILVVAGAVFRIYVVKNGELPGQSMVLEKYAISFLVQDIRETSAERFKPGDVFYIEKSADVFGTIIDNVSVTPAEIYVENESGYVTLTYAVDDNTDGDDGRVDVRGTVLADGYMSEQGFLLGGNTYLAPNLYVTVQSKNVLVTVLVTDITKSE